MLATLLNPSLPTCQLGEGPHWDAATNCLYWVDINGHAISRYSVEHERHQTCKTSGAVGFAIPMNGDEIIAGVQGGLYAINFETGTERLLSKPRMSAHNRFNDGKCDPQGRLWAGTMNLESDPKPTGSLYCYDGNELTEADKHFCNANGKGWSPDHKIMYHVDTANQTIWQYDYNFGSIKNRREFAKIDKRKGFPDGLCVDKEGNVYVALFAGSSLYVFSPSGILQDEITLPVPNVTSCTFGGPNLATLFITTAREGLSDDQLKDAPLSGQIFMAQTKIAGLPSYRFST